MREFDAVDNDERGGIHRNGVNLTRPAAVELAYRPGLSLCFRLAQLQFCGVDVAASRGVKHAVPVGVRRVYRSGRLHWHRHTAHIHAVHLRHSVMIGMGIGAGGGRAGIQRGAHLRRHPAQFAAHFINIAARPLRPGEARDREEDQTQRQRQAKRYMPVAGEGEA